MNIFWQKGLKGFLISGLFLVVCFLMPVDVAQARTAQITKAMFDSNPTNSANDDLILVQFSDHVWGPNGAALTKDDFVYHDNSHVPGMTAITSVMHTAGNNWAILDMNASAESGDTVDTIGAVEGRIFTVAGALPDASLKNISMIDNKGLHGPKFKVYPFLNRSGGVSKTGSQMLLLQFEHASESSSSYESMTPIYGLGGFKGSDPIYSRDLNYNNLSGSGTDMTTTVYHTSGDSYLIVVMDQPLDGSEFNVDTIACSGNVTDVWGNYCQGGAYTLMEDTTGPIMHHAETAVGVSVMEFEMFDGSRGAPEPVYGHLGRPSPTSSGSAVSSGGGEFDYLDANGAGATGINGANHTAGRAWGLVYLNNSVISGDLLSDGFGQLGGNEPVDIFGNTSTRGVYIADYIDPVIIAVKTTSSDVLSTFWSEKLDPASLGASDLKVHSNTISFQTGGRPGVGVNEYSWIGAETDWNTDATGKYSGIGTDITGLHSTVVPNITMAMGAVQDYARNNSPAYTNYNTTVDASPAYLVGTVPLKNAINVATDQSLQFTFSEGMATTFNHGSQFAVEPDPGGWSRTWSNSNRTVTLTHNNFNPSSMYMVGFDFSKIKAATGFDTSSNEGYSSQSYSFNTAVTGGGSGSGSTTPTNFSVQINNNANETESLNVTLKLASLNATEMLISNYSDFQNATWESYKTSKSWTLLSGSYGSRTVYVKFRGSTGIQSSAVTDSITYVEQLSEPGGGVYTPPPATVITYPGGHQSGQLVKSPDHPAVYYLGYDGFRHAYFNEKIYFSWYRDFSEVRVINSSDLAQIPLGKAVYMRPGTALVKLTTSSKVYTVEPGGVLRWIPTAETAELIYGANWQSRLKDIPDASLPHYTMGDTFSGGHFPAGSLIKFNNEADVYYADFGIYRKISTLSAFFDNNFQEEYIIKFNGSKTIDEGAVISGSEHSLRAPF